MFFLSLFLFFPFFLSLVFRFFLFIFIFSVDRADAKTGKNRREVLIVKMILFFCEKKIFGPRWTGEEVGVKNGPFEGDPPTHVFHLFQIFSFFLRSR